MMPNDRVWANGWRCKIIRWLNESEGRRGHLLAATLGQCKDRSPCYSAACPNCGLRFQQASLAAVDKFIISATRPIRGRASAITVVPEAGLIDAGELTAAHFEHVRGLIEASLQAAGIGPVLGSLEASFEEHPAEEVPDRWSIHAHVIAVEWISKDQEFVLRDAFRKSPGIVRPVMCQRLDGALPAFRYPFKPQRFRHISQVAEDGRKLPPRSRNLRTSQAVELGLIDHALGFEARLISNEIDRVELRGHFDRVFWTRAGP